MGVVLVAWVAASRANAEHLVAPSSPAKAEAVESGTSSLIMTSDRPVLSGTRKLGERQRVLSVTRASAAGVEASVFVGSHLLDSPSLISVGPFAFGLAGRGPPGLT